MPPVAQDYPNIVVAGPVPGDATGKGRLAMLTFDLGIKEVPQKMGGTWMCPGVG